MARRFLQTLISSLRKTRKQIQYYLARGRYLILKMKGYRVGEDVMIGPGVRLDGSIIIGDQTSIMGATTITGEVEIGSNVIIAAECMIIALNHDFLQCNALPYGTDYLQRKIKIEDNVWIGSRVCITPGATIGEGAVIGMGSVVRGSIPPLAIAAGNPATVIKQRDAERYHRLKEERKYLNQIRRNTPEIARAVMRNQTAFEKKVAEDGYVLSSEIQTERGIDNSAVLYVLAVKHKLLFGNAGRDHIAICQTVLCAPLEIIKTKATQIADGKHGAVDCIDLIYNDLVEMREAFSDGRKSMHR